MVPRSGLRGLAQTRSLLELIPEELHPYVILRHKVLGVGIIDPLASTQDSAVQQLLTAAGFEPIEVRFGPVPEAVRAEAAQSDLFENLKAAGLVVAGLGALWWFSTRPRRW
jgi:hypothetical protein